MEDWATMLYDEAVGTTGDWIPELLLPEGQLGDLHTPPPGLEGSCTGGLETSLPVRESAIQLDCPLMLDASAQTETTSQPLSVDTAMQTEANRQPLSLDTGIQTESAPVSGH